MAQICILNHCGLTPFCPIHVVGFVIESNLISDLITDLVSNLNTEESKQAVGATLLEAAEAPT